jgi:hypothetical protein
MRKYHHVGIPTDIPRPGETYLPDYKVYHSGLETSSYGIEWMRYEPGSPLPDLVKKVAHVAFEVNDLAAELKGKEILIAPNSPSPGVLVAFIVENGAPVELIQFSPAPNPDKKST